MKKQIFFFGFVLCLITSCASITKNFPKQPRPFQKREFDSEQWKNGDNQTRGEMAENLREIVTDFKNPWKKSADEVRQILGKPDVITQADCCEVGRAPALVKVELWLYYIEIEEDYSVNREKKIIPQAFKLYFRQGSSRSFETVIGNRDGDHSMQMPVVGMINF